MPDFFEVINSQRGITHFASTPIPEEELSRILQAATRAPSGSNRQPWRFIVVREPDTKRALGELYLEGQRRARGSAPPSPSGDGPPHFSHSMEDVPVLVVTCVENWQITGREIYRGASIYPAVQNLMLAAAAVGIGSRLTTIWQHCYQEVADLLGVPEDWEIMALIPMGYPQYPDHLGGSRRKPIGEVTFLDHWGVARSGS